MYVLAELLIEDYEGNKFFLVSKCNDIYVSKLYFDESGFIYFEDCSHHDFSSRDIHSLVHHGKCDGFVLVDNLKGKPLPLHIMDLD